MSISWLDWLVRSLGDSCCLINLQYYSWSDHLILVSILLVMVDKFNSCVVYLSYVTILNEIMLATITIWFILLNRIAVVERFQLDHGDQFGERC